VGLWRRSWENAVAVRFGQRRRGKRRKMAGNLFQQSDGLYFEEAKGVRMKFKELEIFWTKQGFEEGVQEWE
jgi:hypothetical protein